MAVETPNGMGQEDELTAEDKAADKLAAERRAANAAAVAQRQAADDAAPVPVPYVPASHAKHVAEPGALSAVEYVPTAHARHCAAVVRPTPVA